MVKLSYKLLFLLILLLPPSLMAQESKVDEEEKSQRFWVMFVPQTLFRSGVRMEFDRSLNSPKHWLTIATTIYKRDTTGFWLFGDNKVYSLSGSSIEFYYRWHPLSSKKEKQLYLSVGGGYQFTQQEYRGALWERYVENGLNYYAYRDKEWFVDNSTFILRASFGYHRVIDNHIALDLFNGVGVKYTAQAFPDGYVNYPNPDMYSFGYTGFFFIAGLRMGFGW